jgi:hypothetical protein
MAPLKTASSALEVHVMPSEEVQSRGGEEVPPELAPPWWPVAIRPLGPSEMLVITESPKTDESLSRWLQVVPSEECQMPP